MRLTTVVCLAAIALVCCGPSPSFSQEAKYQSVFYPSGMPLRKGFDGQERPAQYHFYDEAQLPGTDASVVLYGEERITGGADNVFTVYLGLLSAAGTKPSATIDVTRYIPVEVEQPGHVHRVSGTVTAFAPEPKSTAVHVNLWAVLSGSGSISGGSDLFFAVDPVKGTFTPLLTLTDTSAFSREGVNQYSKRDADIYLANVDRDPAIEIVVHRRDSKSSGPRPPDAGTADVYALENGVYRLTGKTTIAALPKTATRLRRSPDIAQLPGE